MAMFCYPSEHTISDVTGYVYEFIGIYWSTVHETMRLKYMWFAVKRPDYVNTRFIKGGKKPEEVIKVMYVRDEIRFERMYRVWK